MRKQNDHGCMNSCMNFTLPRMYESHNMGAIASNVMNVI